ncbi:MAG: peptide chain release factor N(5)-glutamine methyltransferase [Flavobacteriales bacterium]
MNQLIADNKVSTLRAYLLDRIGSVYSARESQNMTQLLFQHYLGWDRLTLQLHQGDRLSESEILQLQFALKRILKGEPIQYITKHAWFRGLDLIVGPGVLIPRPETEELVQLVLDENRQTKSPRILDIGTGSGCIALALKFARPDAQLTAIDISTEALTIARKNAENLNLKIEFVHADALSAPMMSEKFDVIVSNPPYVLESDKGFMSDNVLNHEPHNALFVADNDPLLFYRNILNWSRHLLTPDGFVACEMHESMEIPMAEMLLENGISSFSFHRDLQDKTRFVRYKI